MKAQHWKCCLGQLNEGSNPSLSVFTTSRKNTSLIAFTGMSAKDTLARWAGDEFMLILPNIQGAEEAIAKVLNLKLVAAGVETEMQEYLLRSLGRQEVQDYLY